MFNLPTTTPLPALWCLLSLAHGVIAATVSEVAGAAGLSDRMNHPSARHRVYEGRLLTACTNTTLQISPGQFLSRETHYQSPHFDDVKIL